MEARPGTIGDMDDPRALAAQVEAMKDDPSAWGDPEPPQQRRKRKSEQRQRGAVVSVRFTDDELEAVQALAAERGLTMSSFLRSMALGAPRRLGGSVRWFSSYATNSTVVNLEQLVSRGAETDVTVG